MEIPFVFNNADLHASMTGGGCCDGATMFFNNTCEVKYNHDKELIGFIRQFPTRGF